jgi:hypothetical protein
MRRPLSIYDPSYDIDAPCLQIHGGTVIHRPNTTSVRHVHLLEISMHDSVLFDGVASGVVCRLGAGSATEMDIMPIPILIERNVHSFVRAIR